jgi:hypothetical protein
VSDFPDNTVNINCWHHGECFSPIRLLSDKFSPEIGSHWNGLVVTSKDIMFDGDKLVVSRNPTVDQFMIDTINEMWNCHTHPRMDAEYTEHLLVIHPEMPMSWQTIPFVPPEDKITEELYQMLKKSKVHKRENMYYSFHLEAGRYTLKYYSFVGRFRNTERDIWTSEIVEGPFEDLLALPT